MNACDMVCWNCFYSKQHQEEDLIRHYLSQDAIDAGIAEEVKCQLGPLPVRIIEILHVDDFSTMKTIHESPRSYSCGSGRWWDGMQWIGRLDAEDVMDDYEDRHDIEENKAVGEEK